MEDSPHLYISEFGDGEDVEEEEEEDVYQEERDSSHNPHTHTRLDQETEKDLDCFICKHCERRFTSKQGMERHMHTHALTNDTQTHNSNTGINSFGSILSEEQQEKENPLDPEGSVMQVESSPSSGHSALSAGDLTAHPQQPGVLDGHHACKYCEKIFTTHTNKRRHERRVHENHLQPTHNPKSHEEDLQKAVSVSSQQTQLSDGTAPVAVLGNVVQHTEQYMLDVSSDISENLSFYIDGKIVSTSTVSNCEAVEVLSGSSALVGLDALILDPAQISHVLTTESATAKEIPGQPLAKRRTATPPLLPQIKTELESEVVVSSSSSSLVSSLIENLLPQNTESTVVQNERTVFLSPKLKQLLEKQDGLKPTLALITDSQKPCSPVSLSVLPSGRFKRRTGSPQQNTSNEDAPMADTGDFDGSTGQMETHHSSPVTQTVSESTSVSVSESTVKPVLTESWTPMTSGNSCNQQPLDLSNTVKRNDDVASADAALDLSLQRKSQDDPETLKSASRSDFNADSTCALEQALVKIGEQSLSLMNPKAPLVTDFTIVTSSDIVTPVESLAEGLVYSLTLPPSSLTPSSPSLTPVALQPASPCAIAFASPASHAVLPSAPSLITVLAPPPPISSSLSQPIQVLAPNMSSEPLVICAENALNSSECDLTSTFAAANSANLVTLSQPLNPALNLPGHVFLTDPIALNPPIVESTSVSEVPFTPAVTLNDSLLNSYNIASNTVLIECTIALEAPGRVVPAGITLQENPAEPPALPQMLVNHVEQQQIVSVPNQQTVDPTILVSSIEESVSLSTASAVISDSPAVAESSPEPKPAVDPEPPAVKVDEAADSSVPTPENSSETSPLPETAEEEEEEEESTNNTTDDVEHQTFTKNFVCNVCDKLFHSMKELSHHVGDHTDEWPYKCEFCLLLFGKPSALLDHRSNLHGVGKTYVCSACTKEFVYLCNLKQHQEELHPGQQCTHTEEEKGKLRPQNYNNSTKVESEPPVPDAQGESKKTVKKEEGEVDVSAEELFTTIKIMASDGSKIKGPDVRLGINQHYPSFKPPPFPYHNRSPAGSVASATNFTTHNIPQTFSTAIRCTKCGKSFDNMPELHKHILACANASDKRRYTPRKNPIPLRHFAKTQNGVLSTTNSTNSINASNRVSQSNRTKPNQEAPVKFKVLNKRKKKLVQRVMPQRNKTVPPSNKASPPHLDEQNEVFICPHCSREFSMRRSRTKHMAVCARKPTEAKKRKEGGISVTKENDGRLHRGVSRAEEKQQSSPPHKTRLQTSASAKRPAVLPVQTLFSSKRSKIIIKESSQPKQDASTLNELPIVRTFNPAMRQYGRVQHGNKGAAIKFTVVKPQRALQKDEFPPSRSREDGIGAVIGGTGQGATA